MRWEVNRLLEVPAKRIEVVANGVDPTVWQVEPAALRAARIRYAGAGPLIGFAGRLVYEKGVQDLIAAMPQVRAVHPGLRLIVAGDGPYRRELQEEAHRYNLRRAVSFTGFLGDELPAVMAATDAMIVPSIYEPFGMIALEAAATGVPVAAASTGGLKEFVEPGRTGMTFPASNPDALAHVVSRLLSDEVAARRMARTANHVVVDRYGWPTIARRTARVYNAALAEAPAAFDGPAAIGTTTKKYRPIVVPDGNLLQQTVACGSCPPGPVDTVQLARATAGWAVAVQPLPPPAYSSAVPGSSWHRRTWRGMLSMRSPPPVRCRHCRECGRPAPHCTGNRPGGSCAESPRWHRPGLSGSRLASSVWRRPRCAGLLMTGSSRWSCPARGGPPRAQRRAPPRPGTPAR